MTDRDGNNYKYVEIDSLKGVKSTKNISPLPESRTKLVNHVFQNLLDGTKLTRLSVEKKARELGIDNKNEIKELSEFGLVLSARRIAHYDSSLISRFNKMVHLYQDQMNISFRTSMSMILQQFSTPAPISFLASSYVKSKRAKSIHSEPELYFEPSAGNGLLTIALIPDKVIVNELDEIRVRNLEMQGFKRVLQGDGSRTFADYWHKMDGVLTNPPFGYIETITVDRYKIKRLEHLMCIRALETMKNDGRAAIIIGGHTHYDSKGRIKAGQNRYFMNWLYHYYNVEDVINIDGSYLYTRQGTSMDVRLILINGRKPEPQGTAPLREQVDTTKIKSWDDLYQRTSPLIEGNDREKKIAIAKAKAKAIATAMKLKLIN